MFKLPIQHDLPKIVKLDVKYFESKKDVNGNDPVVDGVIGSNANKLTENGDQQELIVMIETEIVMLWNETKISQSSCFLQKITSVGELENSRVKLEIKVKYKVHLFSPICDPMF